MLVKSFVIIFSACDNIKVLICFKLVTIIVVISSNIRQELGACIVVYGTLNIYLLDGSRLK